ncbi:MAG: ribose-phosphate pyrophosphokinase [Alphaproteobacteria bacterium]|jgi:ribose-phosphate pyrophosphokinase|nr:ribose-phosphate pyrophosphokinase [Alphaproteobacteria bacterium]
MKILTCNSNRPLGEAVAAYLKVPLVQAFIQRFEDREVFVDVQESVRGQDIFVIQPTSSPTNDTLMELLVTMDALKGGSARSITAVIPYYGYGRQDRKTSPGSPISAKLVANLLTVAGANRVLTIDWHSAQIQGFFDIPTDNLTLAPLFCREIKARYGQESFVIVSPDVGGLVRARNVAETLSADMAIIDKRRTMPGEVIAQNLLGEVEGRTCLLIDDMVDSAGTLCEAAGILKSRGAAGVDAFVSHGVLSGKALERIEKSHLRRLIISDTIQPSQAILQAPNIEILSVAPLLGEAIQQIACDESVSNVLEMKGSFLKKKVKSQTSI